MLLPPGPEIGARDRLRQVVGLIRRRGTPPTTVFPRLASTFGDVVHIGFGAERVYLASHPDLVRKVLVSDGAPLTDEAPVLRVPEEELGAYYAQRTILKREVLPGHVAAAVAVLTGDDLRQTTGVHVPVDSGVAAAFLR